MVPRRKVIDEIGWFLTILGCLCSPIAVLMLPIPVLVVIFSGFVMASILKRLRRNAYLTDTSFSSRFVWPPIHLLISAASAVLAALLVMVFIAVCFPFLGLVIVFCLGYLIAKICSLRTDKVLVVDQVDTSQHQSGL